ncbi:CCA tRNA nucleotidyltransferase [Candidatus Dependentiae bacterium]|nr:MAG: CCA tRNA nucleotidyltransferase [Candidatus Dependentiae bacterium]
MHIASFNTQAIIKQAIKQFYQTDSVLPLIIEAITKAGGKALLVGGAVRDAFLNVVSKDFDIEIYHMSICKLEEVLGSFGQVNTVGKSFGVLKLRSINVDWSLPRADSVGRTPDVFIDPSMDYYTAFSRRDLTINAIGIDLVTHKLIDPFNGQLDLQNKILRAPNINRFIEDPLRLFRVMQFIGRCNMEPDAVLHNACKTMSIKQVSLERIEQEYTKLLLFAANPSKGFRWLHKINRLKELLPELHATVGVPQDPRWHPEGDVFTHSMQALDAAVVIANKKSFDNEKKIILCCAALCHDLGKVSTTFADEEGIHSYGHAEAGAPLATTMLSRMFTNQKKLKKAVATLVYYHMMPGALVRGNARLSRYQVLAAKLAPTVSMFDLGLLAFADRQGRNADAQTPLQHHDPAIEAFLENAKQAQVLHKPIACLLNGTDLLEMGYTEKNVGDELKKMYKIQIDDAITNKELLKKKFYKKK